MIRLSNTAVRKLVSAFILLGGAVPSASHAVCAIATTLTDLGRANSGAQLKSMLGKLSNGQVVLGTSPVVKYQLTGCASGANTVRAQPVVFTINGSTYKMIPWLYSFDNVNLVQPVNLTVESFPFQHFGLTRTLGIVFVTEDFPDTIPPDIYATAFRIIITDPS